MKVIIKGSVLIKDAPERIITTLKKQLTYENPAYKDAKKNGRFIDPEKTPKYLFYYKARGSTSMIIPRGMVGMFLKLSKFPVNQIVDHTVLPKMRVKFTGKLRDYQELACKDMLNKRYGLLDAATGAGKTITGIAYACERKSKTLVIVHTKELLDQWTEKVLEFTDAKKVGRIGGGDFDIQDITIGIINSVNNVAEQIRNEFGVVILDECHRALGDTWVTTINTLRPKFHMGLSATPYRRQKHMTKALFYIVGPMVHKVDREMLEETGAVLRPRIIKLTTKFEYTYRNDYAAMLSNLVASEPRNILIGNAIVEEYRKYKEPIMVVSDRITHCEVLRFLIEDQAGIVPIVLSGRLSKDYRKQAVVDMKAGEYNVLIATAPLLSEGFDAPDLNSIFLVTPMKFQGRTIQTIGRILRPSDGGQPRVYDFRDILCEKFKFSGFARDRVYEKLGWDV